MPIATLLALVQALVALVPEAEQVIPVVEKMVGGGTPSDTDVATLESVTATLNAMAVEAEAGAGVVQQGTTT